MHFHTFCSVAPWFNTKVTACGMRDEWEWKIWMCRVVARLGQVLCCTGDGCRGTRGQYRGGGKHGILLSNSSLPGGLER